MLKLLKIIKNDVNHNYCTDFMFQEVIVCVMFTFNIVSRYSQFPFSFQDITKVC